MPNPDPLPSWRDGETKRAIVSFVESVTAAGDGHVAPIDRIATFDNDRTLWCEKPAYPQAMFVFAREAKAHDWTVASMARDFAQAF